MSTLANRIKVTFTKNNQQEPDFKNDKETAKDFGEQNTKDFEQGPKKKILKDAKGEANDGNKDLKKFLDQNKNPDIGTDKDGNVWLKSRDTGETINTKLPADAYKE